MQEEAVPSMIVRLFEDSDVAALVLSFCTPIDATQLREAYRGATSLITHQVPSFWAFWRSFEAPLSHDAAATADFYTFTSNHGYRYMVRHRRKKLSSALQARQLEIRADSWLCTSYIKGKAQAGSLSSVVEGVAEMHFYHHYTRYVEAREVLSDELWQDAYAMAMDSASEAAAPGGHGLPPPRTVEKYLVRLDAGELSVRANNKALRWLLASQLASHLTSDPPHNDLPSAVATLTDGTWFEALRMPPRVCAQMRALMNRIQNDEAYSQRLSPSLEEPLYMTMTNGDEKRRAREEARLAVCERREQERVILGPQFDRLHTVASGDHAEEFHFPSTLTNHHRALLHDAAEEAGLAHESRGWGEERHLVVWQSLQHEQHQ